MVSIITTVLESILALGLCLFLLGPVNHPGEGLLIVGRLRESLGIMLLRLSHDVGVAKMSSE